MGLPYSVIRLNPELLQKERKRNREKERLARSNGKRSKPSIEKQRQYLKKEREKNPDRYSAYKKMAAARLSGKLKPLPCEICGNIQTQSHHDDYSKPLNVRWFCRDHHWTLHRKMPTTPIP